MNMEAQMWRGTYATVRRLLSYQGERRRYVVEVSLPGGGQAETTLVDFTLDDVLAQAAEWDTQAGLLWDRHHELGGEISSLRYDVRAMGAMPAKPKTGIRVS